MLGVRAAATFPTHSAELKHGDRLVLYTDGVTEAFNPSNEAYGEQRLIAQIKAHGDGTADSLVERIFQSVTTFAGTAAQSDGMTLAVLVWATATPLHAAGAQPVGR
jgi:sigma-B regulation protein RsbU (phosphoserine phosphatase)